MADDPAAGAALELVRRHDPAAPESHVPPATAVEARTLLARRALG